MDNASYDHRISPRRATLIEMADVIRRKREPRVEHTHDQLRDNQLSAD